MRPPQQHPHPQRHRCPPPHDISGATTGPTPAAPRPGGAATELVQGTAPRIRITVVSSGGAAMDDDTLRIGLLMESAQAHQKLAETQMDRLTTHMQGLDEVVRGEIRRTLIEELQAVTAEARRAAEALGRMHRAGSLRAAVWGFGLSALCAALPAAVAWWSLPTPRELDALRAQRQQLTNGLEQLKQAGAGIELRRCGTSQRLCVRVERGGPVFGEDADYLIVKGY